MINYNEDLHINKNRLDEELMAQAHKMLQYSAIHAQAQYDRDRAKQHRDVVEAELELEARNTPPPDGPSAGRGGEPTRDSISSWIKRNKRFQEAQEAFNKAEFEVTLIFGAVMAMQARKGMLESLVKLFLSGYWSEPKVEGGEDMKARGSLNATEETIFRGYVGPEVLPQHEEFVEKFAVGPVPETSSFEFGPFDHLERAMKCIPKNIPAGIYRLLPNKSPELLYEWNNKVGAWTRPGDQKKEVPRPAPTPIGKPTLKRPPVK